jgi:hypothetical protein
MQGSPLHDGLPLSRSATGLSNLLSDQSYFCPFQLKSNPVLKNGAAKLLNISFNSNKRSGF